MYLEAVARRTHLRVCEHEHIDEFDAEQRYNPKNQSLQIQSWEHGDIATKISASIAFLLSLATLRIASNIRLTRPLHENQYGARFPNMKSP